MYDDLKGKKALVTGSGKKTGIGYAIAAKLAGCGTHVIIADLARPQPDPREVRTGTSAEMAEIARELSTTFQIEAVPLPLDVTDPESVRTLAETIAKRFGHLDILCNNAGASFGVPSPVHAYDEYAWLRTVDVNLHGVYRVSKAIVPLMLGNGGSIINTSSRAGKFPPLFNGAYAVAKAGVIMLTKVMAKELAGNGIRVNAICPGQIRTDLEKWRFELEARVLSTTVEAREREMCATIPIGRIGSPDEVAALVLFLASSESSYMTGQAINVTGGQLMEL